MLAAVIWGGAFPMQQLGMAHLSPFTFAAARFMMATVALALPVVFIRKSRRELKMKSIINGAICGALLYAASITQQIGLVTESPGKAGFLTTLYIVLTPVAGMFLGRKIRPILWLPIICAFVGTAIMCLGDGFTLGVGDFWLILCAILYTMQIMAIDRFALDMDAFALAFIQTATCALLSVATAALIERPSIAETINGVRLGLGAILYTSVMSGGVAYTFQIFGQRGAHPSVAALAMSMEAVFALLFGFLIMGKVLTPLELVGSVIMFGSTLWAAVIGGR